MTPFPFFPLALAFALLAVTVIIHAAMLMLLIRWHGTLPPPGRWPYLHGAWLLVRVAWWTVLAHLVGMVVWAAAIVWVGALPDMQVALYFSSVTYTTVGYGDVLLPERWHLLAGVEGLTGILMAGWSTAFLFAVMTRLVQRQERFAHPRPGHQG